MQLPHWPDKDHQLLAGWHKTPKTYLLLRIQNISLIFVSIRFVARIILVPFGWSIMSFSIWCLRVFVRAMLRTFYYFRPSCHLSRREGFYLVNNRRYSQIQKQKGTFLWMHLLYSSQFPFLSSSHYFWPLSPICNTWCSKMIKISRIAAVRLRHTNPDLNSIESLDRVFFLDVFVTISHITTRHVKLQ